jgi:hypothetical protein
MRQNYLRPFPRWSIPVVVGVILVASLVFYLFFHRTPHAPPGIVLAICRDVPPGMHRVGSIFNTQFDVPEKDFTFHSATRDMPPGILYVITVKDGSTNMVISNGPLGFDQEFNSAISVFSAHIEERDVRTPQGRVVGKDSWGFLRDGDRWRYIRFSGGDEVGYRPTNSTQANMLDQVIGSACVVPKPGS